jgi:hypothetical protein
VSRLESSFDRRTLSLSACGDTTSEMLIYFRFYPCDSRWREVEAFWKFSLLL